MSDLISRQAAIDALDERFDKIPMEKTTEILKLRKDLRELPSIQSEQKRGRWIYDEDEYGIDGYHCDKCGFFVPWDYAHKFINYIDDYKFCPNCGIDMRKEEVAQPEPRWIPCSERLPEEGVNVLLCIKDWKSQKTKMVVSLRRDYNYWDGLGREIRGDIAWMSLPEPYKEGADE